ncbi:MULTISPECIES: helix-turn-helix transcriptional regulator [unclassified Cryobacterium]|uniref:helix-turn-helix domain-containing protein n=1 Tax=unclassified Cryobacterium TaxID=2649013 RepID=UPI002AB42C99|nr:MULTISPECIES: helix-turn-helix transcriptional regulator [unclassified Cryobacterium]MDY7543026.1 helix-turn-helix transcriptional regulator [Cryobacterium sp. 5B3]MEB0000369.1 helix-turn-helix transcriptional regulator [Cryobacterium sp. RTS3]MEB0266083.1 helix-turn-helix transcriptional regulator [Cryobacterium sp. 10I5]MEB0274031.1 helix-turn-helix transcriptional regulator [Cryobacterium sp. 5B3]
MTDFRTETSIGTRIQAVRKHRGIRTTKELADKIPGGNVTEAVLQNIEAGRKSDLSVSQLLNIAKALGVSPLFLLAPVGRPTSTLDLPNLGDAFEGMTVVEFDAWISGETDGAYRWTTTDERSERAQLQAMRELDALIRERNRLASNLKVEASLNTPPDEDETVTSWDTIQQRLDDTTRRIAQLISYLGSAGWSLEGWAT